MLPMRSHADIAKAYERVVARLEGNPSARERPVMTAARDALAWVLGYTDEAPWTRRVLPNPAETELFSEWARAERVNHDARLAHSDPDRFTYGSAVEHALAWARGRSDVVPPTDGWV